MDPANPKTQPTHGTSRVSSTTDTIVNAATAGHRKTASGVQRAMNPAPIARMVERNRRFGTDATAISGIHTATKTESVSLS